MKIIFSIAGLLLVGLVLFAYKNKNKKQKPRVLQQKSIYDFVVKDIRGNDFDFSSLKGKKIMIVNVASKCGYTKQYKGLQALYEKYKDKNFEIIGFPSNDFLGQEPGTNQEIAAFCKERYGVAFPMMSKIKVKGKKAHPLYHYLTKKDLNGVIDGKVRWNFHKFLIDENGKVIKELRSGIKPLDDEIISWIEKK